jgi:hypothetical protein
MSVRLHIEGMGVERGEVTRQREQDGIVSVIELAFVGQLEWCDISLRRTATLNSALEVRQKSIGHFHALKKH